jgi:sulfite exporter TauE/SafE
MLLAFLTGLFSSLHCVGMCGPIALALPKGNSGRTAFVANRLLYNFGRTLTYIFLGVIVGLFGESIAFSGYQQGLSIALGIGLLIAGLLSLNNENRFLALPWLDKLMLRLRKALSKRLGNPRPQATLSIGLLNGFLPCGFVYLALSGAAISGNVLDAASYMALFGLGTIPLMLSVSLMGGLLKPQWRRRLRPVMHVFVLVFATLLILRGMNLGIPFVSPELPVAGLDGVVCE